jgi:hypothetical protein
LSCPLHQPGPFQHPDKGGDPDAFAGKKVTAADVVDRAKLALTEHADVFNLVGLFPVQCKMNALQAVPEFVASPSQTSAAAARYLLVFQDGSLRVAYAQHLHFVESMGTECRVLAQEVVTPLPKGAADSRPNVSETISTIGSQVYAPVTHWRPLHKRSHGHIAVQHFLLPHSSISAHATCSAPPACATALPARLPPLRARARAVARVPSTYGPYLSLLNPSCTCSSSISTRLCVTVLANTALPTAVYLPICGLDNCISLRDSSLLLLQLLSPSLCIRPCVCPTGALPRPSALPCQPALPSSPHATNPAPRSSYRMT